MKKLFIFCSIFFAIMVLSSCSGTLFQPTATPLPTSTKFPTNTPMPTQTSTPLPYDITISLLDENNIPIEGGKIEMEEMFDFNKRIQFTDSEGMAMWSDVSDILYHVIIFAQGHQPTRERILLDHGVNYFEFQLSKDPNGLLVENELDEGESILYIEDFQDRQQDFIKINLGWKIIEEEFNQGNYVLDLDHRNGVERGYFIFAKPNITDFIAEYRFRYLDINYSNWMNFAGIDFRDYSLSTSINPQRRVFRLMDFNMGGTSIDRVVYSYAFKDGAWMDVRLEVIGEQIRAYVDGKQIVNFDQAREDIPSTLEGFSLSAGPGAHLQYDNIILKQPAK